MNNECRTCARRHYCVLRSKIKGRCPFWIPDPYKLWAESTARGGQHGV